MLTFEGEQYLLAADDHAAWSFDVKLFVVFAVLGTLATYFSVNIPYTKVLIEGRWIFCYMGFALISRWWLALLLACLLSIVRLFGLPLTTVFIGNMMYAFPVFLIIRTMRKYVFDRLRTLVWYGVVWFLMILICYQLFHTPAVWAILAFIEDDPIGPAILSGWREQPFFVESLLVGVISALGMVTVRSTIALRASRQELITTLYSIGDGVIATDAAGHIRRMNPVAEALTGWREDEARGQPLDRVFCIFDEQTRAPVDNPVDQVLREGRVVGLANHTLLVARDGVEHPIVDSAAPIRDDAYLDPDGVVLVFRDQSEERAAQRELEESHDRLLLALHNARMGIWDWDIETDRVAWHGEHASLFGVPLTMADTTTIQAVLACLHPDDRGLGIEAFNRTVQTGSDFVATYRVIWPDNTIHWLHSHGRFVREGVETPRRIVGTTMDITERKRAEMERERLVAEIQAQAQRMEQVLATVPTGVLLLDNQGRVVQANPVAEEVISLLAGAKVGDVITHLGERPLDALLTSPKTRGLWHEVAVDQKIFEVIARPVVSAWRDDTGSDGAAYSDLTLVEHWVMVINDVTQERAVQSQLQQQEQLAAVGQLAAGVAHDFNNIMATIVLYAQMSSRSQTLTEQDRERLAVINQQAWYATRLIDQILDFSRRAVLELQPLDLVPVLKEQVKLLERTLPETISIDLTYGPGAYTVNADPTRMQQMITNLAVNARDAMPTGGTLRMVLDRVTIESDAPRPLTEMEPGPWIRLTVSDTGSGIAQDVLPRIFEPFFTTKEPGEGSGLGLPQVQGIVGQHKGHIVVTSREGEGSAFTIYLPPLEDRLVEQTPSDFEDIPMGQGEVVLVVEDDPTVRAALLDSLRQLNYQVLAAADGEEAMRALAERGQEVALVLSDVVMPRMGGIALMHALRDAGWEMPMVLLTGHPLDNELEALHDFGVSDWLTKPPSFERLAHTLDSALRR